MKEHHAASFDWPFLLQNLVMKDFRVRYRAMSLGVFWSLLNPLVMMAVLTFVFTHLFESRSGTSYPLFVLCGLVPYNFFSVALLNGTNAITESGQLLKRVIVPRELVTLAAVLSQGVHLTIQMALLLALVAFFGRGVGASWVWLPFIWICEVLFVCGLALATSAINVYVRDTRYVVESGLTVLFWLVPVFYPFDIIPPQYREIYLYNPVAAMVMAMRNILLDGHAPAASLAIKLSLVSVALFAAGWWVFGRLKRRFYNYL